MTDSLEESCANTKALKESKIKSLCLTCTKKDTCLKKLASDFIAKIDEASGIDKAHLTKVCFDYKMVRTYDRAGEEQNPEHDVFGNLSPRLYEAKIEDRCTTCPPFVKSNCQRRQGLDMVTDIAQKSGTWVEFQVFHCKRELVSIRLPKHDL